MTPLLPAPAQPVALLMPPLEPAVRLAERRRAGGAMIRALLANHGIHVDKVVRHRDGTFTAAIFNWRISRIAALIAEILSKRIATLGFKIIRHGKDYYTGLAFAGISTPMVSFTLNQEIDPNTWEPEPWKVRYQGLAA